MTVEIKLKLDFRNKIPISDQVQAEMRKLIQDGSLQPGDQLPTVRVLASQLKVNFNTIARAYRILDQEGLISTQQGRGTYVVETESAGDTPERTKEEWAEQMVEDLFKKANSRVVPIELVLKAFRDRLSKSGKKKIRTRKRAFQAGQKKRVYTPAGDRGWIRLKYGPGLTISRKTRKTK